VRCAYGSWRATAGQLSDPRVKRSAGSSVQAGQMDQADHAQIDALIQTTSTMKVRRVGVRWLRARDLNQRWR
jgi:hypothetical protein